MADDPNELEWNGTVSFFNESKRFGFIEFAVPEDEGGGTASAYFKLRDFRPSSIVPGQPVRLVKGDQVRFSRLSSPDGSYLKNDRGTYTARTVKPRDGRLKGRIESLKGPDFGLIEQQEQSAERVFFHFRNVLTPGYFPPSVGEVVEYDIEWSREHERHQAVRIKRFDWRSFYHPIEGFARIDTFDAALANLAGLAQSEKWDYAGLERDVDAADESRDSSLPVLKNYIRYTFARAVEQNRVGFSADRKFAAFNTGLVRDNWEPLYGLFERNPFVDEDGREWQLRKWVVAFDPLIRTIQPLPELVTYSDDITKLFWDPRIPIHLSRPHITEDEDNVARWPVELQGEQKLALRQALLDAAEKRMRDRLERNFKVAVPQCYKGKIQLLMPLCLVDVRRADLALVVDRQGDAYYGHTILRIPWAYSNARLVCRPDSDWLRLMPSKKGPTEGGT